MSTEIKKYKIGQKKNVDVDTEYNFFEFEDKSTQNKYSLETLKTETIEMEEKDGFKNLIKLLSAEKDEKNDEKRKKETRDIIKRGKETVELWKELKTYI